MDVTLAADDLILKQEFFFNKYHGHFRCQFRLDTGISKYQIKINILNLPTAQVTHSIDNLEKHADSRMLILNVNGLPQASIEQPAKFDKLVEPVLKTDFIEQNLLYTNILILAGGCRANSD